MTSPQRAPERFGDIYEITLPNGSIAKIDREDLHLVEPYRWRALVVKKGPGYIYAVTTPPRQRATIYLHRLVLGAARGQLVDHINGDTLDNRRCNLRLCSVAQNAANSAKYLKPSSSQFKGVSRQGCKWAAQISTGGRARVLGRFDDEEVAARAYDAEASIVYGEFARLNFPEAA